MKAHPYRNLPDYRLWPRAMRNAAQQQLDPVISTPFKLTTADRVATGGSCFAQHIARHLQASGFNFLVTETAHPIATAEAAREHNYGVFSARYGNIYTARQLLQLLRRAYGSFHPAETVWSREDGRLVDPFRPQISPGGYVSRTEFEQDQRQHFAAVRRMFEELDIFVFTLGLTECWASVADGAVYPLCPGVAGGSFDPERYTFLNLGLSETVADMKEFIRLLRTVNANARVILTVSPVALMATAEDRHVLVSTVYSKSVLRVACDELARGVANLAYFPSYEIITGPHAAGRYFARDLRSVTEDGVNQVMRVFLRHYADHSAAPPDPMAAQPEPEVNEAELVRVMCDEEALGER